MDLSGKPAVILVIGVNGVGKTTTIGKLAQLYTDQGKKVMLAAGDTFRAAASEQLELWAERAGVPLVQARRGCRPGGRDLRRGHSAPTATRLRYGHLPTPPGVCTTKRA